MKKQRLQELAGITEAFGRSSYPKSIENVLTVREPMFRKQFELFMAQVNRQGGRVSNLTVIDQFYNFKRYWDEHKNHDGIDIAKDLKWQLEN